MRDEIIRDTYAGAVIVDTNEIRQTMCAVICFFGLTGRAEIDCSLRLPFHRATIRASPILNNKSCIFTNCVYSAKTMPLVRPLRATDSIISDYYISIFYINM